MDNIFKGATFGNKYITKGGKIARFICPTKTEEGVSYCLHVEDEKIPFWYLENGICRIPKSNFDIVACYQEQYGSLPNDAEIKVMSEIKPDAIELAKWIRDIANTLIDTSTENPIGKYADAVRKIQELTTVDEGKLEELTNSYMLNIDTEYAYDIQKQMEAYKAGYRKAKEND